ncbi:MAG: helix-turn-helix domain-containing protein [Gaiellaceae bacterium]
MAAHYMTTEETAERLRCSLRTVQQLVADGAIPHRKIAGMRRVLIPPDELDEALAGAPLEVVDLPRGGRVVRVKP